MGTGVATRRAGPSRVRTLFSFPNPVNEVSARLVAAGVVVMCVLTIALDLRVGHRRHRLRLRGPGADRARRSARWASS